MVTLPAKITEAAHKASELQTVQDILGSASTDYSSSSANRAANIQRGTELLNGTVVYPGESVSVTELVIPFDEENGYAPAPSYENGEVVDSYGGGICQVSTTLYMSLFAGGTGDYGASQSFHDRQLRKALHGRGDFGRVQGSEIYQ